MAGIWDDFSTKVKSVIESETDFTAGFYTDSVPTDASLPYAVMFEGNIDHWMTFSNVTAGEGFSLRVLLANDVRNGGTGTLKTQTNAVNKAIHLQDFSTTEFRTISCKRTGWSQPFKVDEDALEWHQYIDFEVIIQYKEESSYFDNFNV